MGTDLPLLQIKVTQNKQNRNPDFASACDNTNTAIKPQKKEALNLVDEGLLRGHNKEIAPMRGSRHREYSKKGSNPQGLPPTPEQGKPILLDL